MPARIPMGEAVPGSRLDRLYQGQCAIRRLRREGHTFKSIATETGLSARTVASIANGRRAPRAERLDRLRQVRLEEMGR
jgi:hypothetical protein